MLIANKRVARTPYPTGLKAILNIEAAHESRDWLSAWRELSDAPTPLYEWPGIATRLGVANVSVKDESVRSALGSFKALGAPIALVRLVMRLWPQATWTQESCCTANTPSC